MADTSNLPAQTAQGAQEMAETNASEHEVQRTLTDAFDQDPQLHLNVTELKSMMDEVNHNLGPQEDTAAYFPENPTGLTRENYIAQHGHPAYKDRKPDQQNPDLNPQYVHDNRSTLVKIEDWWQGLTQQGGGGLFDPSKLAVHPQTEEEKKLAAEKAAEQAQHPNDWQKAGQENFPFKGTYAALGSGPLVGAAAAAELSGQALQFGEDVGKNTWQAVKWAAVGGENNFLKFGTDVGDFVNFTLYHIANTFAGPGNALSKEWNKEAAQRLEESGTKLTTEDQKKHAFLTWYAKPDEEKSYGMPATFAHEKELNAALGAEPEGVYGLVQGLTQSSIAMAQTGLLLKGLTTLPAAGERIGAGLELLDKSGVSNNLIKGAISDNLFFDVHKERLSNLVQKGPLANPIAEYLSADPNDNFIKARLKATLEGMMTGATVEFVMGGLEMLKGEHENEAIAEAVGPNGEKVKLSKRGLTVWAAKQLLPEQGMMQQGQPEPPQGSNGKFPTIPGYEHLKPGEVPLGPIGKTDVVEAVQTPDGRFHVRAIPGRDGFTGPNVRHVVNVKDADRLAQGYHFEVDTAEKAFELAQQINVSASHELYTAEKLLPGEIQKIAEQAQQYQQEGDFRSAAEIVARYGLNPRYVGASTEEALNHVKSMVDLLPEPSTISRGKPISYKEVQARGADLLDGMSGDDIVALGAKLNVQMEKMPAFIDALRTDLYARMDYARRLYTLTQAYPNNEFAMTRLQQVLTSAWDLHSSLTGMISNTARALNQTKNMVGPAAEKIAAQGMAGAEKITAQHEARRGLTSLPVDQPWRAPSTGGLYDGLTRGEIDGLNRFLFLGGDQSDPLTTMKLLKTVKPLQVANQIKDPALKQRIYDAVFSLRVEAMLSGPLTHVTNTSNNILVGLTRPLETYWAGVISHNKGLRLEGAETLKGMLPLGADMWRNYGESWRAAKLAFAEGTPQLDPAKATLEHATGTDTGYVSLGSWNNASWLNKVGRLSSRLLISEDEWAKQMNYRAKTRAMIMRQAYEDGVEDPAEISRRLNEGMKLSFTKDGAATNSLGLEYTRNATFTDDAGPVAKWLQQGAMQFPWFRIIMPFIRTPSRIFNYAWERTPGLNLLLSKFRDDINAGGERAALAQAKTHFGLAMWGTGAMLSLSGKLTGAGPQDRELRDLWLGNNRPYTLQLDTPFGPKYLSLRRAEPLFMPFSIIADIVGASGEMDNEQDFADVAFAFAAAVSANITNKTYMQGLSQTLDAFASNDPHKVQRLWDNTWASFYPNIGRQLNGDPYLREVRSFSDDILARTPGLSSKLEPRTNIMGEKILMAPGAKWGQHAWNPFTVSDASKVDDVQQELFRLGRGFALPAEKQLGGIIDLKDRDRYGIGPDNMSPYLYIQSIIANPPPHSGKTMSLRQALGRLIHSKLYQKMPADSVQGPGGERWMAVNQLVNDYQTWALDYTLQKSFKEKTLLWEDWQRGARSQAYSLRFGRDQATKMLDALDKERQQKQSTSDLVGMSGAPVAPSYARPKMNADDVKMLNGLLKSGR